MPFNLHEQQNKAAFLNDKGNIAFKENNTKKAFMWYQEAIYQLTLCISELTLDDRRSLSVYQNNAAISCDDVKTKIKLHLDAIISLDGIIYHNFCTDDFRQKAIYHANIAFLYTDPNSQEIWLQKAIAIMEEIVKSDTTPNDLRQLAFYKRQLGFICLGMKEWEKVQVFFNASLASYDQIPYKNQRDLHTITAIRTDIQRSTYFKEFSPFSMLYNKLGQIEDGLCDLQSQLGMISQSTSLPISNNKSTLFQNKSRNLSSRQISHTYKFGR
jgi:tetratricopeptide (TPR) repeat protein